MEKKKFSIELPKGGMSNLAKLKDVKREIERVKFESNVKLNIRQLVNAIILAFIKEHSDELKNIRSG